MADRRLTTAILIGTTTFTQAPIAAHAILTLAHSHRRAFHAKAIVTAQGRLTTALAHICARGAVAHGFARFGIDADRGRTV